MALSTFTISPVDIEKRKTIDLSPGNTIRVWLKIEEKGKTRLQAFEGLVIARKHGTEAGGTFTVRKVASGVGMEKTFPLYSPVIDKIEVIKKSKVRRSKLYYIRDKAAKEIRRRMKQIMGAKVEILDEAESRAELAEAEAKAKEVEAQIEATEENNDSEIKTEEVTPSDTAIEEVKDQEEEKKEKTV